MMNAKTASTIQIKNEMISRNRVLVRGEMGPGGLLTVHVADNGPGIPARERDRIFSSFSRSERSGHGPTGASLLAGRLAAEALGGSLTLMPRSDFGTEFTVSVPIAEFGH